MTTVAIGILVAVAYGLAMLACARRPITGHESDMIALWILIGALAAGGAAALAYAALT